MSLGTCEELIIAYYGLIKPHLDQISSALLLPPPGKIIFSANGISALHKIRLSSSRGYGSSKQLLIAQELTPSVIYVHQHTCRLCFTTLTPFGHVCMHARAFKGTVLKCFLTPPDPLPMRCCFFFPVSLLIHLPPSLTNPPSPLTVVLSGSPGRSK